MNTDPKYLAAEASRIEALLSHSEPVFIDPHSEEWVKMLNACHTALGIFLHPLSEKEIRQSYKKEGQIYDNVEKFFKLAESNGQDPWPRREWEEYQKLENDELFVLDFDFEKTLQPAIHNKVAELRLRRLRILSALDRAGCLKWVKKGGGE